MFDSSFIWIAIGYNNSRNPFCKTTFQVDEIGVFPIWKEDGVEIIGEK